MCAAYGANEIGTLRASIDTFSKTFERETTINQQSEYYSYWRTGWRNALQRSAPAWPLLIFVVLGALLAAQAKADTTRRNAVLYTHRQNGN